MSDALTVSEQRTLAACVEDYRTGIERGTSALALCGQALKTINDQRLYRHTHDTFEKFCTEVLKSTGRRAYQLIAHVDVMNNLQGLDQLIPNANRGSHLTERATRHIANLEPEQQRKVVQKVIDSGEQPTARAVEKARQEIAPKLEKPTSAPPPATEESPPSPAEPLVNGKPGGMARANVVMQIRLACREADRWTDEECREEVADELEKWLKRFRVATEPKPKPGKFKPPTVEEVAEYIESKDWSGLVDAEEFHAHYRTNGWKVGKGGHAMKDWQAAVVTWVKTRRKESGGKANSVAAHNREVFKQVTGR